jgi:Undecaprenyl-phosphate glucose phosphotransferase
MLSGRPVEMGHDVTDLTDTGQSAAGFEESVRPRIGLRFELIEPLAAIVDALVIVSSSVLGGVLYHVGNGGVGGMVVDAGLGALAALCYSIVAHAFGLYQLHQLLEGERDKRRVLASWTLAILILGILLFLLKSGMEISRGSFVCFFFVGGAGLTFIRHMAKHVLGSAHRSGELRGRRAIVIGTRSELLQFTPRDLLARFGLEEIERIVFSSDTEAGRSQKMQRGQAEMVLQRVRQAAAEEIVVAASWSELAELDVLFEQFRIMPLPVRLLPDRAVSAVLSRQVASQQRWDTIELQRTPLSRLECLAKRLLDVAVAASALLALSPILVLAATAIKLESRGPVIFRQRRHGFNGEPFIIYKLRTMSVMEDGAAVTQAQRHDRRVTRIGRLLRETSIDELPQLWNVLRGDMSIVGPRPHAMVHDHEYGKVIANYAFRHHVKPGMTGWAQVMGFRGGTPRLELMQERIRLDLWYIDNWSLMLDVYIMIKTAFELMRQRNAY